MKSPIKFSFFMAMPLEAANLYFKGSPVDFGFSIGSISLEKLMNFQFNFIHWPGLNASNWLEYVGYPQLGMLAIVTSGYLDTVLLLIAAIYLLRWLRPKGGKRPPLPIETTEE